MSELRTMMKMMRGALSDAKTGKKLPQTHHRQQPAAASTASTNPAGAGESRKRKADPTTGERVASAPTVTVSTESSKPIAAPASKLPVGFFDDALTDLTMQGVDVKKEFKKQIQREEEDLQQLFTDVRDSEEVTNALDEEEQEEREADVEAAQMGYLGTLGRLYTRASDETAVQGVDFGDSETILVEPDDRRTDAVDDSLDAVVEAALRKKREAMLSKKQSAALAYAPLDFTSWTKRGL